MNGGFDLSHLTRVAEPAHQVLSHLIHHCAPDPATRTTLSAALVMSMWQLRHRQMSEHVPSMILLNAAEAAPDPVDDFVETLIQDEHANQPGVSGHRFGIPIPREDAPGIMARAIQQRSGLGSQSASDRFSQRDALLHEEHYREAQKAGFGSGWSRSYSKAWAERFGLLTDSDDGIILRLNEGPDRAAFRHDVLQNPERLLTPTGIGRNLEKVIKTAPVSGSLTVELWDEELVTGIIKLGLPVLFLPHHAREPMVVGNPHALEALPQLWRASDGGPVRTSLATPPIDWFDAHAMDIRRRLRHLPGQGSYEFAILQVLHQIVGVCHQIACHAGSNPAAKPEDVIALSWDLHARAFRGVTLGVAALAWHCLGFDPGARVTGR